MAEPGETPYLAPGTDPDSLKDLGDRDHDWRRGCIPIESQGDTYFTYLLVAGPDRGRVVYIEYERSWIFFPREPDFLSWYTRWLREAECKVYKSAGTVLKDLFYESINSESTRFPRPYRLEMPGNALADLGMYRTPPADGILLHPLIALAIRQESDGRLPSTAWDWGRKLKQMKKLQLVLSEKTVQSWDDERRCAYLRAPEEHFPPEPYYYDLRGWSAIGRMENLRELRICEICVEDFSFLTECKNLRTLSLYNTNFTDCRLLLKLPKLKYVDLRSCRLIHKEVLEKLHAECEL